MIVRLALAETFGNKCGILALYEPTTNLDVANTEALALALQDLIGQRQRQSNSQWMVITHDENFTRLLGRNECADFYWKVTKKSNGNPA